MQEQNTPLKSSPTLIMDHVSFTYRDVSEEIDAEYKCEGSGVLNKESGALPSPLSGVSDITFSINPGQCTVLCGRSGEGKSTILRLINGLAGTFYPGPVRGSVSVCGVEVAELTPQERVRYVGVVNQDPRSQFFMGTVQDEIAFSLENLGVSPDDVLVRVHEVAAFCGVERLLGEKLTQLSSGQKQRVALAAALACKPRLLVMDEPTSNLDREGSRELVQLLGRLKQGGVAIVVTEHRAHAFLCVADEFLLVEQGRLTKRWTTHEFAHMSVAECVALGLRHPDVQRAHVGLSEIPVQTHDAGWSVRDLSFMYRTTKRGCHHVTADFPAGLVTVIKGKNGAGKTTLAKVIAGAMKCRSGSVLFNGQEMTQKECRMHSYFVMQDADYQLYAGSVADEVVLGRELDVDLKRRAWESLDTFDLRDLAERHPQSLSGGQKQRVTLAAAYCSDADLIILDEPTSGLDGKSMVEVARWCRTLAEKGKSVVIITHDEELARLAGDSVVEVKGDDRSMSKKDAGEDVKRPNAFKKLLHFMQADKGTMVMSLLLACIGETIGMIPYVCVAALAAMLVDGSLTLQVAGLLALAAAAGEIGKFFFTWQSSMISHGVAFRALRTMREQMAEKMARVPMGTIIDTPTGTFKNRFVDNVNMLEDSIAHFMPELPSNVFAPVLAMGIVFAVDWRMGLAGLATIPLGMMFYAGMMRGYEVKMSRYMNGERLMNSTLIEYVNGIEVIKAFSRSASSYGAFSDAVKEYHDSTLAWFRDSWVWMAAAQAVMPCTLLISLPLGVWLMSIGELALSEFMICIVIPLCFVGGILKFGQAASLITRMDACLNEIWDFLEEPELVRPTKRVKLGEDSFEFKHVGFAYHEGVQVLHDVNFKTMPGHMTALVGPSGSGKSTVAKLLAGFWDATEGAVCFGGRDVKDIPFEQLMEKVSYVSQDTFLFDMSIADNIRLGRPGATNAQVQEAARLAGAHDFIMALPDGYETFAGDAGDRLSGGERQRITIARAILKNAPIVILDEATAYADPENEALVERALSKLVADKTLIVIAHRLSTIVDADQILVMSEGIIAAQGTHEELLQNCELYQRMWVNHQSALMVTEGEEN